MGSCIKLIENQLCIPPLNRQDGQLSSERLWLHLACKRLQLAFRVVKDMGFSEMWMDGEASKHPFLFGSILSGAVRDLASSLPIHMLSV